MGKKYAYLTIFVKNPKTNKIEYLIGKKKFMNALDGYIGTNPNQYVIPGGNVMRNESTYDAAIREFEEETAYKLKDLNCKKIKKIHQNKYADFYMVEVPYQSKEKFIYSKDAVIALGQYYEFTKFIWLEKEEVIKKILFKPKKSKMIETYICYIRKNKNINPVWVLNSKNSNCYDIFSNIKESDEQIKNFTNILKEYIISRSDNDWFVDCFNKL